MLTARAQFRNLSVPGHTDVISTMEAQANGALDHHHRNPSMWGRCLQREHYIMSAEIEQSYSGKRTAEIVGITYRQLDYWARTDLVRPSLQMAQGSGSRRCIPIVTFSS